MTEIIRERYAWYTERIGENRFQTFEAEEVLSNPKKYLMDDESPFCKCGHHVKEHGYSSIFGEEFFCFHEPGDKGYKPIFVDWDGNKIDVDEDFAKSHKEYGLKRCPCEGFEPYKIT